LPETAERGCYLLERDFRDHQAFMVKHVALECGNFNAREQRFQIFRVIRRELFE
jgi:hypothetical protein